MIEENISIHSNYTLEVKLGFIPEKERKQSRFAVNFWLFIPPNLDIHAATYEKKDFYRDVKSNIRLITPVFTLTEIIESQSSPLLKLEHSVPSLINATTTEKDNFEHHTRMFLSVVKSALRNVVLAISNPKPFNKTAPKVEELIDQLNTIVSRYRRLEQYIAAKAIDPKINNYYHIGDEYLSNVIEYNCFRLMKALQHKSDFAAQMRALSSLIEDELRYKKSKGMLTVDRDSADHNRAFVKRLGYLKKYAENVLFVSATKKRGSVLKQQLYYSLAAGISMVFATAVAFSFQRTYGNFTMPFFVALVVSYMLKDRIKELGRYYFAHKSGSGYFDLKTKISLNSINFAKSKEAMDFIEEHKVPRAVLQKRGRPALSANENNMHTESILLYRKLLTLNRQKLNKCSDYALHGFHDIVRINFHQYTRMMDNPDVPLFVSDGMQHAATVNGEKTYEIQLVLQLNEAEMHQYRLIMNRDGIKELFREN
ncbi:MAG: hypothetical protein KGZ82_08480 [Bacteroidales bacterium]|nr:hypothetical protein [Bacteroidales bacterium]